MRGDRRPQKNWWRAPQNPAATHYVYENAHVKGGLRFTLLAIALEMPRRCTITRPMLLAPLMKWTRYTEQQTRNHLDDLEDMSEVARHREAGSKRVRYEMPKLAGPLFVVPSVDEDPKTVFGSAERHPKNIFGSPPLSRSVRTRTGTTATDPPAEVVLTMHAFEAWWNAEIPTRQFRHGQPADPIDLQVDGDVVVDLFRNGEPVDLVQACAQLLWTIAPDANPKSTPSWCANSDHNVRVLRRHFKFFKCEIERLAAAPAVNDVWSAILERLASSNLARHDFHTWFKPLILVRDDGKVIEVAHPGQDGEIFAAWIPRNYAGLLQKAVDEVRGESSVVVLARMPEPEGAIIEERAAGDR